MNLLEMKKQLLARGEPLSDAPWTRHDPERAARWAAYFEGKQSLTEDRVLNYNHVPAHERVRRQRQCELILDNTVREMALLRPGALLETTAIADIETFTTQMLPVIRKIWPRLFGNEIVSTQVAKGPSAKAFTVDFKYGTTHSPYTTSSSIYPNEDLDYSADPGEGQEPNELDSNITSETISMVAKKLKYQFNQEAAQDAASQYGIDLDPELLKMTGQQIEREINRLIITGVSSAATTNTNWASDQPASPNAWANADPKKYAESLWDAVCDADQEIYERVYQRGNVILCGPTFGTRLRKMNAFRKIDRTPGEDSGVTGPNLFGTLNETYKIFEDAFYTTDKCIVVHKSDNWMYTGYVYMPYVGLWTTPLIHNSKMQPARGVMSRYGLYAKNGDFFATVTVT